MSLAIFHLCIAGLLISMCIVLPLTGRRLEPLDFIAIGMCLCIALEQSAAVLLGFLKRVRAGFRLGEERPRRRVQLGHAITPLHRREAAERLLKAHFNGQYVDGDVSRLDHFAADGWRVVSTEPVKALHLSRGNEQRVFIPRAWTCGWPSANVADSAGKAKAAASPIGLDTGAADESS